jgi:hypothetical protein
MLALETKLSLVQNFAQYVERDDFFAVRTSERQHNDKKQ